MRLLWASLALLAVVLCGCRATRPSDDGLESTGGVAVTVDVIPMILRADTSASATVWVTVTDSGEPVADSTLVSLVASRGTIPSEVLTSGGGGLAVASYEPVTETGVVSIIAQALGVRDTMNITLY